MRTMCSRHSCRSSESDCSGGIETTTVRWALLRHLRHVDGEGDARVYTNVHKCTLSTGRLSTTGMPVISVAMISKNLMDEFF